MEQEVKPLVERKGYNGYRYKNIISYAVTDALCMMVVFTYVSQFYLIN